MMLLKDTLCFSFVPHRRTQLKEAGSWFYGEMSRGDSYTAGLMAPR